MKNTIKDSLTILSDINTYIGKQNDYSVQAVVKDKYVIKSAVASLPSTPAEKVFNEAIIPDVIKLINDINKTYNKGNLSQIASDKPLDIYYPKNYTTVTDSTKIDEFNLYVGKGKLPIILLYLEAKPTTLKKFDVLTLFDNQKPTYDRILTQYNKLNDEYKTKVYNLISVNINETITNIDTMLLLFNDIHYYLDKGKPDTVDKFNIDSLVNVAFDASDESTKALFDNITESMKKTESLSNLPVDVGVRRIRAGEPKNKVYKDIYDRVLNDFRKEGIPPYLVMYAVLTIYLGIISDIEIQLSEAIKPQTEEDKLETIKRTIEDEKERFSEDSLRANIKQGTKEYLETLLSYFKDLIKKFKPSTFIDSEKFTKYDVFKNNTFTVEELSKNSDDITNFTYDVKVKPYNKGKLAIPSIGSGIFCSKLSNESYFINVTSNIDEYILSIDDNAYLSMKNGILDIKTDELYFKTDKTFRTNKGSIGGFTYKDNVFSFDGLDEFKLSITKDKQNINITKDINILSNNFIAISQTTDDNIAELSSPYDIDIEQIDKLVQDITKLLDDVSLKISGAVTFRYNNCEFTDSEATGYRLSKAISDVRTEINNTTNILIDLNDFNSKWSRIYEVINNFNILYITMYNSWKNDKYYPNKETDKTKLTDLRTKLANLIGSEMAEFIASKILVTGLGTANNTIYKIFEKYPDLYQIFNYIITKTDALKDIVNFYNFIMFYYYILIQLRFDLTEKRTSYLKSGNRKTLTSYTMSLGLILRDMCNAISNLNSFIMIPPSGATPPQPSVTNIYEPKLKEDMNNIVNNSIDKLLK